MRKININTKKAIIISSLSLLLLAILTAPTLIWRTSSVAQIVAWPALFIEWLLYYISFGIGALLLGAWLYIFVDGSKTVWVPVIIAIVVAFFLMYWLERILTVTDFVPFSSKHFVPIFDAIEKK